MIAGPSIAALAVALLGPPLAADGKFFIRDETAVPPGEPFQRALLIHDAGRELLVIQPQLSGNATEFAWVVPVPTPPALGRMDLEMANYLFVTLDRYGRPEVIHLSDGNWLLAPAIALLILVIPKVPFRKKAWISAAIIFVWFLAGFFTPTYMSARGAGGDEGVSVLSRASFGIYDTAVVRSEKPEAMEEWLRSNGFRASPEDHAAIRSYVERGWCFVAAKIASQAPVQQEGLLEPLTFDFPSKEPVYPFALTVAGGRETRVVLYVFTRGHRVEHPAMRLAYANAWKRPHLDEFAWAREDPEWKMPALNAVGARLDSLKLQATFTKLRGDLSARNVAGDLVLQAARDNWPYRETVWRW